MDQYLKKIVSGKCQLKILYLTYKSYRNKGKIKTSIEKTILEMLLSSTLYKNSQGSFIEGRKMILKNLNLHKEMKRQIVNKWANIKYIN